jgi:hypothetical protein
MLLVLTQLQKAMQMPNRAGRKWLESKKSNRWQRDDELTLSKQFRQFDGGRKRLHYHWQTTGFGIVRRHFACFARQIHALLSGRIEYLPSASAVNTTAEP